MDKGFGLDTQGVQGSCEGDKLIYKEVYYVASLQTFWRTGEC